jgi:hypothetical protein
VLVISVVSGSGVARVELASLITEECARALVDDHKVSLLLFLHYSIFYI